MEYRTIREHADDPVQWLKDNLDVSFQNESEILRIALKGEYPKELAELVNAIRDAYMDDVANAERQKRTERFDKLDAVNQKKLETLARQREEVRTAAESLGSKESAGPGPQAADRPREPVHAGEGADPDRVPRSAGSRPSWPRGFNWSRPSPRAAGNRGRPARTSTRRSDNDPSVAALAQRLEAAESQLNQHTRPAFQDRAESRRRSADRPAQERGETGSNRSLQPPPRPPSNHRQGAPQPERGEGPGLDHEPPPAARRSWRTSRSASRANARKWRSGPRRPTPGPSTSSRSRTTSSSPRPQPPRWATRSRRSKSSWGRQPASEDRGRRGAHHQRCAQALHDRRPGHPGRLLRLALRHDVLGAPGPQSQRLDGDRRRSGYPPDRHAAGYSRAEPNSQPRAEPGSRCS